MLGAVLSLLVNSGLISVAASATGTVLTLDTGPAVTGSAGLLDGREGRDVGVAGVSELTAGTVGNTGASGGTKETGVGTGGIVGTVMSTPFNDCTGFIVLYLPGVPVGCLKAH